MLNIVRKSSYLQGLDALASRRKQSKEEIFLHKNAQQGYEGERKFAQLVRENIQEPYGALYGLLLAHRNNYFEIDCLLVLRQYILLVEVKNYIGEFTFQHEQLYSEGLKRNYANPLHQITRAETNLTSLLADLNISLPVHCVVVFVNQAFTLFTEKNKSIILPTQIPNFLQKINRMAGGWAPEHQQIIERLSACHHTKNHFASMPNYSYATLRKGLFCQTCRQALVPKRYQVICPRCRVRESLDSAITRAIIDYHTLFPDDPITTSNIHSWIGRKYSKNTVRLILKTYLEKQDYHKRTHYIFKS